MDVDVIVGPAMGGIVYAYELARQTGKDVVEHRAALFQINGAGLEGVGQADGCLLYTSRCV